MVRQTYTQILDKTRLGMHMSGALWNCAAVATVVKMGELRGEDPVVWASLGGWLIIAHIPLRPLSC